METIIYSFGVMAISVSAITMVNIFNIGYNITYNNKQNFFVNIGYFIGLFYVSILLGFLLTINLPWIIFNVISNSSDTSSPSDTILTIKQIFNPIIMKLIKDPGNSNDIVLLNNKILQELNNEDDTYILSDSKEDDTSDEDIPYTGKENEDTSDEEKPIVAPKNDALPECLNEVTDKTCEKNLCVKCEKNTCVMGSYFGVDSETTEVNECNCYSKVN